MIEASASGIRTARSNLRSLRDISAKYEKGCALVVCFIKIDIVS